MKQILMTLILTLAASGAQAWDFSNLQTFVAADIKKASNVEMFAVPASEKTTSVQKNTVPVTIQDLRDTRREIFRMDSDKLPPSQQSKAADLLHKFSLEILRAETALLKTGKAELSPEYLNKKVNPRLAELRKTELKAKADFSATGDDGILLELNNIFAEILEIHLSEQTFGAL